MAVHQDQPDSYCKHRFMTFRACVKLPIYVDGIDAIINTQIMKTPHYIIVHLTSLYHERKPEAGTLKK